METVRFGPLVLPAAMIPWGLSLAAHATVLVVGIGLARSLRDKPPGVHFARGDGGSGIAGAGAESTEPSPLVLPRTPGPPIDASQSAADIPFLESDEHEPAWRESAPPATGDPTDRAAEATGPTEDALIGLPAGELPAPLFAGARPPGAIGPGRAAGTLSGGGQDAGAPVGASGDSGGDGRAGTPGGVADARLPAPRYPRESRLRGEEGTVVLEIDLAADGSVTAVRVRDDAGYPRLAAAAVEAVNKGRFVPATRDGRPVASMVRIPFRFLLKPSR